MDAGLLTTLGRRAAQRICVRSDVGLLDEKSDERTLAQLRDLSSTGASVRTSTPLKVGKEFRLAFEFDRNEEPIRLHGEVVWSGRAEGAGGGILSGLRFLDLAGSDFGRLRRFIDTKLWKVQEFLSSIALLGDLSDLEKLLLASVSYDRELDAGEPLEESSGENSLIMVRAGTLTCREFASELPVATTRHITVGEFCGSLPVDPRGGSRVQLKAVTPSAVLCIPNDGFWYLWTTHSETALKLLSCWSLYLRDRMLAVEPVE